MFLIKRNRKAWDESSHCRCWTQLFKTKRLLFVLLQDVEEGEGESETPAEVQPEEEVQLASLQGTETSGTPAEVDAAAEKALPSDDDDLDDEEDEQVKTKQETKLYDFCHQHLLPFAGKQHWQTLSKIKQFLKL